MKYKLTENGLCLFQPEVTNLSYNSLQGTLSFPIQDDNEVNNATISSKNRIPASFKTIPTYPTNYKLDHQTNTSSQSECPMEERRGRRTERVSDDTMGLGRTK